MRQEPACEICKILNRLGVILTENSNGAYSSRVFGVIEVQVCSTTLTAFVLGKQLVYT